MHLNVRRTLMGWLALNAGLALLPGARAAAPATAERIETHIRKTETGRNVLDLKNLIAQSLKDGVKTVSLPAGTFYLKEVPVRLENVPGLTIGGAGADATTIISPETVTMLQIFGSDDVTLRDFSIDYDPVPFTQGTITGFEKEGEKLAFSLRTHDGYPELIRKGRYNRIQFYDGESRRLKAHWTSGRSVTVLDNRHAEVSLHMSRRARLRQGDLFVLIPYGKPAVVMTGSSGLTVRNVDIYASPGRGINCFYTTPGDNLVSSVTITRGSRPEDASEDRLLSANQDAVDFYWGPGSVTVEDCEFAHMGDDATNFHAPLWIVVKTESPKIFWVAAPHKNQLRNVREKLQPGSMVEPLDYPSLRSLGKRRIAGFAVPPEKRDTADIPADILDRHPRLKRREKQRWARITLQKAPEEALSAGDKLFVPSLGPQQFVIRNCYFHDFRGRVLLEGMNGVVENNRIERATLAAIMLGFQHGAWVENIVIRNNTLRDVCTDHVATSSTISHMPGAITISTGRYNARERNLASGHRNIRILGNTIDGAGNAGIFVNLARDVEIRGNILKNTNLRGGEDIGADRGLTAPYAITIMNSADVRLKDNKISSLGLHGKGGSKDLGNYPAGAQK